MPKYSPVIIFYIIIQSGNGFASLPPIIMYGDELINRAFESSVCIISNKIANSSLYPLEFFSLVIAFYLWHVLVTDRLDIEKKYFWYISGAIWLYTIIYNIFELLNSSKYENWGVKVSVFNCKLNMLKVNFYGYVVPTTMIAFITIIMTCKELYNYLNRLFFV
jgi:hypothetical protein